MKPSPPIPHPTPPVVTRRDLLKLAVIGAAGAAVGVVTTSMLTRLGHGPHPAFRTFSDADAALLTALCERLIPRDDAPGATDLGVIHYIDRNLQAALSVHRTTYKRGLEQVSLTCQRLHGRVFAALSFEQQDTLLRQMELGQAPPDIWMDPMAPEFFNLVLAHTMQGFYGSPRHGGNLDYASYRMLGVDYPQIIGQNRPGKT